MLSRRSTRVVLALAVVVAAATLLPEASTAQCAMCRTAFDSPEGQQMVAAYRRGVLFLLAVPFLTFGTVAWLAIRGRRRVEAAGGVESPDVSSPDDATA